MTERLGSIQRMRGIAALLVVLAHCIDLVQAHRSTLGRSRIVDSGHLENFGTIGVDLFFVISGFVMKMSIRRLNGRDGARDFLALRWIRIAPRRASSRACCSVQH